MTDEIGFRALCAAQSLARRELDQAMLTAPYDALGPVLEPLRRRYDDATRAVQAEKDARRAAKAAAV